MKLDEYKCSSDERRFSGVDAEGFSFPQVHYDVPEFIRLAKAASERFGFVVLPLCNTVEAENVGANVILADAENDSRIAEPKFARFADLLALEDFDFEKGRMKLLLEAVHELSNNDKPVMVQLTGANTFFSYFVDSTEVIKAYRKNREAQEKMLAYLLRNDIEFIKRLDEFGASIISVADPISGVSVIGPAAVEHLVQNYVYPLIKYISENTSMKVYLCPKLSTVMKQLGVIAGKKIYLTYIENYHSAIVGCEYKIFGDRCYKNNKMINEFEVYELAGGCDE